MFEIREQDFEEFFSIIDPFYTNQIRLASICDIFSGEIIDAKMKIFARPAIILSQLNAILTKNNKVDLLRNLFSNDVAAIGRVNKRQFLSSFQALSRKVDTVLVEELFELICESPAHERLNLALNNPSSMEHKFTTSAFNTTRDQSLDDTSKDEPYVELSEFCKKLLTNTE